jgi:uncharacterized protein YndB with AHSA1/START domain
VAHAQRTIVILRPPEIVFDFLADGTNNPRWRSDVVAVSRVTGEESVFHQTIRVAGREVVADYEIAENERPTRLVARVLNGSVRPVVTFALHDDGDGATVLTCSVEVATRGAMRLAAPLVARQLAAEIASLDAVKSVLEETP